MSKLCLAILLCTTCGWASAHSLSPPIQKALFINGITVVRFEGFNLLPETREFDVVLYKSVREDTPLDKEYYDVLPVGFTLPPGETRSISVRLRDDGELKRVFVCTRSRGKTDRDNVVGLTTRVCSLIKLYRRSDLAVNKPAQR